MANEFWLEMVSDLNEVAVLVQIGMLAVSLMLAWGLNRLFFAKMLANAPQFWKVGVDGVARVAFPLLAVFLVNISQVILRLEQHHTGVLKLAITLLLAMAILRLAVYTLRYVFSPSGWLRTTEGLLVGIIWSMTALHLTGLLPEVTAFLDDLGFTAGTRKFSVLLLIQSLLIAVITLMLTMWAGRILENRLMRTEQLDINLRVVLSKLIRVALIVVGVLSALSVVGFDITLLSVFGGALGVGLGFGLQKIASNYVSGFIILLDRSLHLGDVLTVDGHYGVVHQLRARYLVLRKLDGTEVVIPNDALVTSTVINHSLSDRKTQLHVAVQVSYNSDLDAAMRLMQEATAGIARVLAEPAPDVVIKELGGNGVNLDLSLWVNDPEKGYGSLQSLLYMNILQSFRKHGIYIPSQQRDVRMLDSHGQTKSPQ